MRWLPLVVVLGACSDGNDVRVDATIGDVLRIDTPDGPPLMTLSQTTSPMVEAAASSACFASPSGTAANNYYRVFDLAALGIAADFHVSYISFEVEHCQNFVNSTGANVTARVGTYAGTPGETLAAANMVLLASNNNVAIPEVIEANGMTPGATVIAPVDAVVPAGQKLMIEIDAPDGASTYTFFMGANNDGESAPAYVLAPYCGVAVPTNVSTVAGRPLHLLLSVSGWY